MKNKTARRLNLAAIDLFMFAFSIGLVGTLSSVNKGESIHALGMGLLALAALVVLMSLLRRWVKAA